MPSRPIGIFDSGVGGLSVLKELKRVLPNESYLYFGDTARVPYGEKSNEELIQFSREIIDWFKSQNVKMVLMACNTSSAVTLATVQKEYDFPILGLIEPTALHVSTQSVKKIGLMATTATVNSGSYPKAIQEHGIEVKGIACPGLVEIVEKAEILHPNTKEKVFSYLEPLLNSKVEKIILGCTHYPFLKDVMCELGCKENMFVDPAECLSQHAYKQLELTGLLSPKSDFTKFFVSGNPAAFAQSAKVFFDACENAEVIDLKKQSV